MKNGLNESFQYQLIVKGYCYSGRFALLVTDDLYLTNKDCNERYAEMCSSYANELMLMSSVQLQQVAATRLNRKSLTF